MVQLKNDTLKRSKQFNDKILKLEQKNAIHTDNNNERKKHLDIIHNEYIKINQVIDEIKQNFESQSKIAVKEIRIIRDDLNNLKQQYSNDINDLRKQISQINKNNNDITKLLKWCQVSDPEWIYNKFLNEGFDSIQKGRKWIKIF